MTKRKLAIILSASAVALAGLIVGGVFLVQHLIRQNSPEFTMSDAEYLVARSPWHKLNEDDSLSEKLIWSFNEDGTGAVTTNAGRETYPTTWTVEGNRLTIITAWLYPLTDTFTLTTDRELGHFTIVDEAENKTTTFAPGETLAPAEQPIESE